MAQHCDHKDHTRKHTRHVRAALTAAQKNSRTEALTMQLIAFARATRARTLACYAALPHEPDTGPFLAWARAQGIRAFLPIAHPDRSLSWAEGPLRPGAFGIHEPTGPVLPPHELESADAMLIPASAVDRSGMRVGWGLGYYDRCLSSLAQRPPVFAVVYDSEVYDAVPHEPHDVAVDGVITEARWLRLPSASSPAQPALAHHGCGGPTP